MKRREFLGAVGASAFAGSATFPGSQSHESAAALYERAYAIDAMCFSMEAPPRAFVQYLRPDKIEALRTSGITAMAMNMTSYYDELNKADSLFVAVQDRITTWDAIVAENADVFLKVTNMAELEEAKRSEPRRIWSRWLPGIATAGQSCAGDVRSRNRTSDLRANSRRQHRSQR